MLFNDLSEKNSVGLLQLFFLVVTLRQNLITKVKIKFIVFSEKEENSIFFIKHFENVAG